MNSTKLHIPSAKPRKVPPERTAMQALREAAKCPEKLDHAVTSRLDSVNSRRTQPSRRSRLPELAPADSPRRNGKAFVGIDMSSTAVIDEETRFARREESGNDTAKITVYVMNAILLIMAFPVGFGMLVFNILGGENLRTTSHVIALTGFAIALTGGAFGSDFLFAT